jgi:prevent-host-death family protein
MSSRQSIKPISYLKAHAADVIKEPNDRHGTMIITQHGEAKAIIQDINEVFEELNAKIKQDFNG